ncbi:MAG: MBL fold metallo-hydrolase [Opitutae bacterium]|nr:MBL fold metallo-hydrolase [Opitutae bacterium]
MPRNPLWVLGLGALLASSAPAIEDATRWTMLMVTPRDDVADSHLIELPGGINVLIDAGRLGDSPGAVLAQLRARHINSIDLAIISHFHLDHYGALIELIENGISIKRVAVNVPHPAAADREQPWGCYLPDVRSTLESLSRRNIPFFTPKIGDRLVEIKTTDGTLVSLDVLCVYNGLNTPIGLTDVNDTSIIVRLSHGATRVLFTGDLNHPMGAYLAGSIVDLRADLLKAPHHGTDGTVPNEFYDRVGAKAVLVPSPKNLWRSARSMRTRNYFIEHGIPVYVSGVNGNVTATLTARGYRVETER